MQFPETLWSGMMPSPGNGELRPARESAARGFFVVASTFLAAMIAACSKASVHPPTTVASIEANARDSGATISLFELARAGNHRLEPVPADGARPVRVLQVLAVDVYLIEGDRGQEEVRVHGIGGADPRLEPTVDAFLRSKARPAVHQWLTAADAAVEEVLGPEFIAAGVPHPPFQLDVNGRRVVSLLRRELSEEDGVDVRAHLVESGWAYHANPFTDPLAVDPRGPFTKPASEKGLWSLPAVGAMAQSYAEDAERVLSMEDDAFQAFGESVLEDVADWLEWQPAAPMVFRVLEPDAARDIYLSILEEARSSHVEWLARTSQPALPSSILEWMVSEEVLLSKLGFDAQSPAGPTVFWQRNGHTSRRMMRALLVHEIMHQYQEETICAGKPFGPIWVPLLEGHAESLAARFLREQDGLPKEHRAISYHAEVGVLEQVCLALGLTADEIFRRYLEREWEGEQTKSWIDAESGQQHIAELLLALESDGALAGLSFSAVAGSEGLPVVEVRNTRDDPFRGQLSGVFMWSYDTEGESGTVTWSGPPCNLALAPQSSIRLLLGNRPLWTTHPPRNLIGLFSPTWQPR